LFVSAYFVLADPVLVRRDNAVSRLVTLMEIKSRAQVDKIAIFPEGTCSNREMILKFRLGAFTPALPIQMVYIQYERDTGSYLRPLSAVRLLSIALVKQTSF
jgi:1-acyl-sn-glycerol-3-phosphate acyltransferase